MASPSTRCRSRGPLRGFFPLTLAAQYNADEPYGWATTFEQGIPDVVAPDLSSGRLRAAELLLDADPGRRRVPRPHPLVEHLRTSGGWRRNRPWTWRTSAPRRTAASPTSTRTRRTCRAAAREPPVVRHSRQQLAPALGPDHEVALPLAAGRDQPAVQERADVEGRLHAVEGQERGRRRRVEPADVQRAEPAGP